MSSTLGKREFPLQRLIVKTKQIIWIKSPARAKKYSVIINTAMMFLLEFEKQDID